MPVLGFRAGVRSGGRGLGCAHGDTWGRLRPGDGLAGVVLAAGIPPPPADQPTLQNRSGRLDTLPIGVTHRRWCAAAGRSGRQAGTRVNAGRQRGLLADVAHRQPRDLVGKALDLLPTRWPPHGASAGMSSRTRMSTSLAAPASSRTLEPNSANPATPNRSPSSRLCARSSVNVSALVLMVVATQPRSRQDASPLRGQPRADW